MERQRWIGGPNDYAFLGSPEDASAPRADKSATISTESSSESSVESWAGGRVSGTDAADMITIYQFYIDVSNDRPARPQFQVNSPVAHWKCCLPVSGCTMLARDKMSDPRAPHAPALYPG